MSAGIGASVYGGDLDYDVVYYYDEELIAHDFASWVDGNSMEPTYKNGEVALIRETGFDYDGGSFMLLSGGSQTHIKKVYREEEGLRLVSINKDYLKFAPFDENPRVIGKIVGHFMPLED